MKVGFLVNPIAGLGGAVGLKGTDGASIIDEAIRRGAKRKSPQRAVEALTALRQRGIRLDFVTCAGEMGVSELESAGLSGRIVYTPAGESTREDTVKAARAFISEKVDIILFAGGDGTARDIIEAVDGKVPIVGIPSGVKMHSAVFANTPEAVADSIQAFESTGATKEAEVMDVDEEGFRRGVLQAKLFGYAMVPDDPIHMQSSKMVYHSGSAEDEADELGQYIAESLEPGVMYIVGPGSTTKAIAKHMGVEKTLLGVDVYLDGRVLAKDASESTIAGLLREHPEARVLVSPVGAQGFALGRGNQQLSPQVLRKVGTDNVVIISTPTKLRETPMLKVDTGDRDLDDRLRGKRKVLTGYKRKKLVTVI